MNPLPLRVLQRIEACQRSKMTGGLTINFSQGRITGTELRDHENIPSETAPLGAARAG